MKKLVLAICFLSVVSGCAGDKIKYPSRPKDTPYFYNDTSITEANPDICIELRRARELTNIEFVTVLLKEIPDNASIGKFAAELFHKWKIGSTTNGKGVLILFVEDIHTLKIEVSYDLEGTFTDAFCSSFQQAIKGYFADKHFGDVFTGIILCMELKIIKGINVEFDAFLKDKIKLSGPPEIPDTFLSGGGGIIENEYFYGRNTKLPMIRQISEEKILEFDCDKDIHVVLTRYFKTLEEGINYPFLGIFTEGSQMMRLEYPMSIYDLQTELKGYQKEFPYRIIYNKTGDLAAIRFKGLLWPLFLRQTPEGFWKLDITKGWAFSQANYNLTGMYPLYRDHPWMFAYTDYPYEKSRCNIPKLIPFPLNIKSRIEELQDAIRKDPGNASNYFKLADIFYWECFWVRAAIDVVEKGLKLEPDNVPYRWLVIYMLYRYPKIEDIPAHYKALLKLNPCDDDTLYRCTSHYSDLLKQPSKAKMIRIKYKTRCLLHTIDVTPVLIVLLLPGVVVIVMVVVVVLIVKRISSSTSQSGVENKHSQQQ